MTSIDTNVDNYTITELMDILGLDNDNIDKENIIKNSKKYIIQYQREKNEEMVSFFNNIQNTLLEYLQSYNETGSYEFKEEEDQTQKWFKNQNLKQKNSVQSDKVTERKNKIDVYDNQHVPMKREQLGINNTFNVDIAQGTLNPNLKNTTERIINLDSQYRQSNSINNLSTDYTLDLSESIIDVVSLRLYSFQIPFTWYLIDNAYSNTSFWISFYDVNGIKKKSVIISIEPGNYTSDPVTTSGSLVNAIYNSLISAGFNFGTTIPINVNLVNGKITMNLYGGTYVHSGETYTIDETTIITFFDPTGVLTTDNLGKQMSISQTLGWIMGYRVPFINVLQIGNIAPAVLDVYGPKYLILVIDDYNQNHINNGLIGITEYSNFLKLPSYYTPDLTYVCEENANSLTNLEINSNLYENDPNAGNLIMDKYNKVYGPIKKVIPTAPRKLTQSQIYTINEIMKNNGKTTSYKIPAPTTTDTFAIIPIKRASMKIGDVYVDFGGSLQDNKRIYFGPVNFERLHVKLLDDKGNVLNLNGVDWSFTLMTENLYQY